MVGEIVLTSHFHKVLQRLFFLILSRWVGHDSYWSVFVLAKNLVGGPHVSSVDLLSRSDTLNLYFLAFLIVIASAVWQILIKIFVEFHFHDFSDIISIFSPFFGCFDHFLIFSLPVVREPASNLLCCQARSLRQHRLVYFLDVGVVHVVQEPLL